MFLDSDDSIVGGSGSGGARLRASIPTGHGSDPFACPCCANVFSEVLRLADVDLGLHAASLEKRSPVLPSSALITHARILTMNEAEPTAEAMWVREGRIEWVGRLRDRPDSAAHEEVLDFGGRFVLPGFIEPHMHLPPLALLDDCRGCRGVLDGRKWTRRPVH